MGRLRIGAELQIVWSCLSRTSRCRVLSAALCPAECFPVRIAPLLCKPQYAVKERGRVVRIIEDKGGTVEGKEGERGVSSQWPRGPGLQPPQTSGDMFYIHIAFSATSLHFFSFVFADSMLCFVFRIGLVQYKMIWTPSTDLWMSHIVCCIQADLFFRAETNIVCGPARGACVCSMFWAACHLSASFNSHTSSHLPWKGLGAKVEGEPGSDVAPEASGG